MSHAAHAPAEKSGIAALTLGALGVVFGDIGTSPLYTMKETFGGSHPVPLTPDNILGVLSLILWALIAVVSLKYVVFIMRADNKGEGGIMALIALAQRTASLHAGLRGLLIALGIFGASLFYGDSIITPAISVLSAMEGLEIATPAFKPFVEPLALVVLIALFFVQRRGTASVGALFGPVMLLWFGTLAALGLINIAAAPQVLAAINPAYAYAFFQNQPGIAFIALGAVVLAVTGGEALYADMGHFGRVPIRLAWFAFVLPALLLNYFGQGALLIRTPEAIQNPFYLLGPDWLLYPMVALSTAATVIASQAVITGAFSVTRQAIQLGYAPRMSIQHTSDREIGQIYVPFINWLLLAGIVALILGFQSSSNLAAAYGIAVTGTMAIDTLLAFFVFRYLWNWRFVPLFAATAIFLTVDLAFFSANSLKIFHGGWFPLAIGAAVFTLLSTWKRGRALLFSRLSEGEIELKPFVASLSQFPPTRVTGTAVFLTAQADGVPHAMLHNLLHNKVLHERVVFLTVHTEEDPYVPPGERIAIEDLGHGFYRIALRYGFKDEPDVPRELAACAAQGLAFDMMETSFFLSRETIVATALPGMALWRERLFIGMARNAASAMSFFKIPTNRVIELGTQVEI